MNYLKAFLVYLLTLEARAVLRRYRPKVIAVTGSVGKTTTKDAIYAAISQELYVRKSEKSFNTGIGVPLTIMGLDNAWNNPIKWLLNLLRGVLLLIRRTQYPEWLILEVGADRPGDIKSIARWLRPDIAVLTGVPEVPPHVEYFSSVSELFKEKRSLAEHLQEGGKLVLNGDDEKVRQLQTDFWGASSTYGLRDDNDFFASHTEIIYDNDVPRGIRFRANRAGASVPVAVYGALGSPRIYAALAALAVGEIVGVDLVSVSNGLALWEPPPGRVRILKGERGSVIIDDTYNSSPAAAYAALDTLKEVKANRRIAILGDMLELGRYTSDAHRKLGIHAAKCADMLITVGFRARLTAEAALDAGMPEGAVRQYDLNEASRVGDELEEDLREGDVVLVKGSQGVRLEKAVLEMMAEPDKAAELLVRMDAEWQTR